MTTKVGPKGQVVIPKPIRDRLGIAPGDDVVFWLDGEELRLKRAGIRSLRGRFKGSGLTRELEAEHGAELEQEAREQRLPGR